MDDDDNYFDDDEELDDALLSALENIEKTYSLSQAAPVKEEKNPVTTINKHGPSPAQSWGTGKKSGGFLGSRKEPVRSEIRKPIIIHEDEDELMPDISVDVNDSYLANIPTQQATTSVSPAPPHLPPKAAAQRQIPQAYVRTATNTSAPSNTRAFSSSQHLVAPSYERRSTSPHPPTQTASRAPIATSVVRPPNARTNRMAQGTSGRSTAAEPSNVPQYGSGLPSVSHSDGIDFGSLQEQIALVSLSCFYVLEPRLIHLFYQLHAESAALKQQLKEAEDMKFLKEGEVTNVRKNMEKVLFVPSHCGMRLRPLNS